MAATNPTNFVTSRIRVDNIQNIAILEYRSSEGAVVRQYPTQAQIQAFKRAEQLAAEHHQQQQSQPQSQAGSGGGRAAPAPASNPAPQPSTAEIVQASTTTYTPSGGGGGGDTGASTQSVEV